MKRFFIPLAALFSLVSPALTRAAPPIYPGVVPYEQLDTRNFYLGNYPILRIMPFMPKDTPPYLPVDTWSFAVNTNLWTLYAYDPPNTTWHQVLGLGGITVTVNPTDTYIPYRANATTFLDSPWNVVATNKLGFYGPVSFLVYSNLSVGLGMNALVDNTGSQNVAIGDQALQLNTTGNGNVAIGNGALYAADTSYAIGIGVNALNAGSGSANIAIGHGAMATSPTAAYSVAIGEDSMEAATASYNTAVGHESGKTLGAGQYNTILGEASGGVTDGNANVVVGSSIGNMGATHEAKRSVVIGSGNANTTTNLVNSVIVGTAGDGASPRIATSSANLTNVIAIGYDIGITNSNQIVIGNSTNNRLNVPNMVYVDYSTKNTALGYGSQLGGGGGQNTSVGYQALPLAGNQNNDAFGNYALFSSTPNSDSSTALGGYSLYSLTNGTGNVAVGYDSQYYLTNGVYNTAIGFRSLEPNRDGNYNVSVGATTLFNEKHGGENVAVGYNALRNQNGQGGNTALGAFAGQNVAAQTNVIVIGHGSTVTNDNDIVIGNSTNSRVILPIASWGGTGSKVLTDNGTYQTASSVITGAISSQLLWTNSPTGGGSLTASSNVIASLPTGLYGSIFNNSEDIFAVGENAGQGQAVIQSTNLYNIGLLSGYGMTGNEAWMVMNIGDAAGRGATVYNSQDVYNFGIAPGELSQITNGSWVVMNIGDNAGYAMVTDKSQDIFNYGWLSGDSMGVSNSIAIFNYGDWAGRNNISVIQNSQEIYNYGYAAGVDQNPRNSTNLYNYGNIAGGVQQAIEVNGYYNYGTDSGWMGVGLASNSEELYNYGAWAGASLAALVADGTFVNFTNVYNYGPEAGMQIKGTNATYILNYGYRAGEQSTMTGVSDLYNYGSDSGFQSTYDTSATDIYNYGTSAGKGASYTNSFFILNSGNSAGQSMVAQDSSSIVNLGSYAGAQMITTNSSSIVNIGPYAGNLENVTNSTYIFSYGDRAGNLLIANNSSADIFNYGHDAGKSMVADGSTLIFNFGDSAGLAMVATNSAYDVFNFGLNAGSSMVVNGSGNIWNYGDGAGSSSSFINSADIYTYGNSVGADMVLTNAIDIYAYGYQALYRAKLTNSSNVYAYGNNAGASLAGDGYSDIYLFGTAQPTRKTNEFVFGSANDLYTFPGNGGIFAESGLFKQWLAITNLISDVRAFGAHTNFAGTTAAIQAAIDAMPTYPGVASFGSVDLPAELYTITSTLHVTKPFTRIRGNGTILYTSMTDPILSIEADHVEVSGINFSHASGGTSIVSQVGYSNAKIHNCRMINPQVGVVAYNTSANLAIENCVISGATVTGVYLDTVNDAYLRGNDITRTVGATNNAIGLYLTNCSNTTVIGNSIEHFGQDVVVDAFCRRTLLDGYFESLGSYSVICTVRTNAKSTTLSGYCQLADNGTGLGNAPYVLAANNGADNISVDHLYAFSVGTAVIHNEGGTNIVYGSIYADSSGTNPLMCDNMTGVSMGSNMRGDLFFTNSVSSSTFLTTNGVVRIVTPAATSSAANAQLKISDLSQTYYGGLTFDQDGGYSGGTVTRLGNGYDGDGSTVEIGFGASAAPFQVIDSRSILVRTLPLKVQSVGGIQDGRTNVLTSATGKDFFYVSVPNTNGIGGHVVYTVFATDGTDVQEISGDVKFAAVAKSTTVTASTADVQAPAVVTGGSTLTAALAANTATNNVFALGVTATTSLTTTNVVIKWRVETPSTFTINAIP